jgi:hypothetical protein
MHFGRTTTSGAKHVAEKLLLGAEGIPQRLKPSSLQSIYVRPEGRTVQENEFSAASTAPHPSAALNRRAPTEPLRS